MTAYSWLDFFLQAIQTKVNDHVIIHLPQLKERLMSSEKPIQITLHLDGGEGISPARLEQMTRRLRAEIRRLNVESVELLREDNAPEGSMSLEAITLGALILALSPVVLDKLFEYLINWRSRGSNPVMITLKKRSEKEEIEIQIPDSISKKEKKEWIALLTGDSADSS